jgi:hypothetical protein
MRARRLGVDINEAALKKYPFKGTRPFPPAFHEDGSLASLWGGLQPAQSNPMKSLQNIPRRVVKRDGASVWT